MRHGRITTIALAATSTAVALMLSDHPVRGQAPSPVYSS